MYSLNSRMTLGGLLTALGPRQERARPFLGPRGIARAAARRREGQDSGGSGTGAEPQSVTAFHSISSHVEAAAYRANGTHRGRGLDKAVDPVVGDLPGVVGPRPGSRTFRHKAGKRFRGWPGSASSRRCSRSRSLCHHGLHDPARRIDDHRHLHRDGAADQAHRILGVTQAARHPDHGLPHRRQRRLRGGFGTRQRQRHIVRRTGAAGLRAAGALARRVVSAGRRPAERRRRAAGLRRLLHPGRRVHHGGGGRPLAGRQHRLQRRGGLFGRRRRPGFPEPAPEPARAARAAAAVRAAPLAPVLRALWAAPARGPARAPVRCGPARGRWARAKAAAPASPGACGPPAPPRPAAARGSRRPPG